MIVGKPWYGHSGVSPLHVLQGQAIYAFVVLKEGFTPDDQLKKEMWTNVRNTIGAFAAPDVIRWVSYFSLSLWSCHFCVYLPKQRKSMMLTFVRGRRS